VLFSKREKKKRMALLRGMAVELESGVIGFVRGTS
jgi:hypothetical protein